LLDVGGCRWPIFLYGKKNNKQHFLQENHAIIGERINGKIHICTGNSIVSLNCLPKGPRVPIAGILGFCAEGGTKFVCQIGRLQNLNRTNFMLHKVTIIEWLLFLDDTKIEISNFGTRVILMQF
jgi:hypothetical protein